MSDIRDRAVHRVQWVVATHHLPATVADVLTDALDALQWSARRDTLTDEAVCAALAAALSERAVTWQHAIAVLEALQPHSFDDIRRSDAVAALQAAAEKAKP